MSPGQAIFFIYCCLLAMILLISETIEQRKGRPLKEV
jgi:hypothetical protein